MNVKTLRLLESLKFKENEPHAEPLHVDKMGRVLLFGLRSGQSVREHNAPNSPVYIVILKGSGMFAGGDGVERRLGANDMLVINPGEMHAIRALDEDLVFVAILHGSPWSE
jgi:quercetin dioxygenase-like cupin family protein